jgi:hypothetical protein
LVLIIKFIIKETSVKDEVKKAVDTALKKGEREVKLAKEETTNFKTKAEDMEQKFTRVIYNPHDLLLWS